MAQCRNDMDAWRNGTAYRAGGRQGRGVPAQRTESADMQAPDMHIVAERDTDGADPS